MKLKIWHQGDASEAICPRCNAWKPTIFEYRTVHLDATKVDVPDVLAGICTTCHTVVSIPQQSAPKLQMALRGAPKRIDVRIPKELYDIVGMLAAEFGGIVEPFSGGLVRYYLRELAGNRVLARRVTQLACSPEAQGTSGGRLAFRTEELVFQQAWEMVRSQVKDHSEMIRGIIVTAKHDAYEVSNPVRRAAFRAIAAAAT